MKKLTLIAAIMLACCLSAAPAQAHIVGLGWTFGPGGSVTFDALHWHGSRGATVPGSPISSNGALILDGTFYDFTTVTNNVNTMTGLDGALVNPSYSSWNSATGVLTATNPSGANDWLHVTVSNLAQGNHTVDALGCSQGWCLTDWTLTGGLQSFQIITPPPSGNAAVPEPATMLLMGSGLVSGAFIKRRKKA